MPLSVSPNSSLPVSPLFMPQLDSIRFLAVLLVFSYHLLPDLGLTSSKYFDLGTAVSFFFVLSSYLLSRILLAGRHKAEGTGIPRVQVVKLFLARRALRILPLYYGFLLLLLLLPGLKNWIIWENLGWHVAFLSNFQFYADQQWGYYIPHFWTLAVEEQFYLVWPWVILFVPVRHLPKVFLGMIGSGVLFRGLYYWQLADPQSQEVPFSILTPMNIDSFGFGALLAYQHTIGLFSPSHFKKWLSLGTIGALGVWIALAIGEIELALWSLDRTFVGIMGMAVLLKASTGFGGVGKIVLENKVFLYLGKISYGIYVYHFIVPKLYSMGLKYLSVRSVRLTGHNYLELFDFTKNEMAGYLVYLLLTILMASASWHFFEQPINNLKRYFQYEKKITPPQEVAVPIQPKPRVLRASVHFLRYPRSLAKSLHHGRTQPDR
jgi:peptidoglycan/LPS O-acetylase OafA/YrhL